MTKEDMKRLYYGGPLISHIYALTHSLQTCLQTWLILTNVVDKMWLNSPIIAPAN